MRRQLPVYSPLTLPAILGAVSAASTDGAGEREALRAELAERFDADAVLLTDSGTHALQIARERIHLERFLSPPDHDEAEEPAVEAGEIAPATITLVLAPLFIR